MNETIAYYDATAEAFTKRAADNIEMIGIYDFFLSYLPKPSKDFSILDLGCGSGVHAKYFADLGFSVTAMDGSKELCSVASTLFAGPVLNMAFDDISFDQKFDAVWANASLLHVSSMDLPDILKKIHSALKKDGVFFSSYKHGTYEGQRNGRFFNDMTAEKFRDIIEPLGLFDLIEGRISTDCRLRLDKQSESWYQIILRKK